MRVVALVLLAACSFQTHATSDGAIGSDGSGSGSDGSGSGSGSDGSGSGSCDWAEHLDVCSLDPMGMALTLTKNAVFNTDAGTWDINVVIPTTVVMQKNNTPVRVIIATAVTINDNVSLRAVGSLPLVIYTPGAMTIGGTIDVESHAGDTTQIAGARAINQCPGSQNMNGTSPSMGNNGAGGGGAGGAFNGHGGDGGADGDGDVGGTAGSAVTPPNGLLGGCPGGNGGPSDTAPTDVPPGGNGGGAVELIAAGPINFTQHGQILAGGAGGTGSGVGGSGTAGGGGGGGSGGYIGLATLMQIKLGNANNHLAANGGGGGAGGRNAGNPGQDGQPDATRANGGVKNANGSDGGKGGAGGALTADGISAAASAGDSGGGGGGGAGYILIQAPANGLTNMGGTISPDPTQI